MRFFLRSLAAGAAVVACSGDAPAEPLPDGVEIDRLVVDKSDHEMVAYDGDREIKTYRIAIGQGGLGPKQYEGDKTTPIGRYRIDSRHESKSYHLFLHISYPNAKDRRRYRRGVARGEFPAGVGAGSAIGIHGQPDGLDRETVIPTDWTHGCIAVSNDEVEELYERVERNATIVIRR